ncbi:MAG: exonuclease [Sphingobacterium sp.]
MTILDDFLVKRDRGFYCAYGDFYIDPLYPVDRALVSHAHGDHASGGHAQIYCSKPTAMFMQHRFAKKRDSDYYIIEDQGPLVIKGVEIVFIPAGHMLGSCQILMIYRGVRYLYTGDYKLQPDPTCDPIQVVEADVLITETTFAHPNTKHPDPLLEIKKLALDSNILLGCYALGKAQRITALLNNLLPEKRVLLHRNIMPYHRIYDQFIDHPLRYEPYNRKTMKEAGNDKIYLVPPLTFNSYRRATGVLKAFASGWERLQAQNDVSLYISDHVDWSDILTFVSRVKPKAIWTLHGDGRNLHEYFRDQITIRDIFSENYTPEHC